MTSHKDIHGFFGDFRWLSNFWPSEVEMDWCVYPSVEHAYQAAKTLDKEYRANFLIATRDKPANAKRFAPKGKMVRPDWLTVRVQIMDDLLRQKFSKEPLMGKLLATGDCLIEETNNWGDVFWGVCEGKGDNVLGNLLMDIRRDLRECI